MMWEADFTYLKYRYIDLLHDIGGGEPADGTEVQPASPEEIANAAHQPPPETSVASVVNMADFDSTLYFLDEPEIEYLQGEITREYQQDLRANVVAALFDIIDGQTDPAVRSEAIENVHTLMAYLLVGGHFRGAAFVLRESQASLTRAHDLAPEHRQRLAELPVRLSAPDTLAQLLQSLDDAPELPPTEDLEALFTELQPAALATVFQWLNRTRNERLRPLLESAAERLASANTAQLVKLIDSPDPEVSLEAIRRSGGLKAQGAVQQLAKVLASGDVERRQVAVTALSSIGSPGALQALERALDDDDREVRVGAARAYAAQPHRPAAARLEAAVKGKVRNADLTERMAFFEAYGAVAGDAGIRALRRNSQRARIPRPPRRRRASRMRGDGARPHRISAGARGAAEGRRRKGRGRAERRDARAPRPDRSRAVTAPTRATATQASDSVSDAQVRRAGRGLIFALYGALRAVKLYPVENAAVQKALGDVTAQARGVIELAGELELRMSGEFIFVNETRLRLDLDNFASFSHLLSLFRGAGIGSITLGANGEAKDWLIFLSLLQAPSTDDPSARFDQLVEKLSGAGVSAFSLTPATDQHDDDLEKNKERAKRTYAQSVAATRDLMTSVRMGAGANIKKVKRVVQGIVDQILNEETSLIGLTTLRDYDEYTFTHSVNVCIFAVALGKRLGLTKLQLYDLGMAALFHDIGKSRVPQALLTKADGLSEGEWVQMAAHPWLGVFALFQIRGAQELPYRSMVVAYEHHMKLDLSGYPRRRTRGRWACSARSSRSPTASTPRPRGASTRRSRGAPPR